MIKIVYRICCGMDIHKSFVVACIASTNEQGVTTHKSKRFPPSLGICAGVRPGWLKTTAKMFAWNLRESIGFLFTTFWSLTAKLFWLTPNM